MDRLSFIVAFVLMYGSGLGVTMGAHRLWSHRAFKAKTGLKIFLLWLHTLAGQVFIFDEEEKTIQMHL